MVQHKQTKQLLALKYINKAKCCKMKAVANIIQERRLLEEVSSRSPWHIKRTERERGQPLKLTSNPTWPIHAGQIDHPFVVNLRYAFQDDENCFFVLDLMLGGDLRCESRAHPRSLSHHATLDGDGSRTRPARGPRASTQDRPLPASIWEGRDWFWIRN